MTTKDLQAEFVRFQTEVRERLAKLEPAYRPTSGTAWRRLVEVANGKATSLTAEQAHALLADYRKVRDMAERAVSYYIAGGTERTQYLSYARQALDNTEFV